MNKTTHLSDAPPLMAFYNAEYNFSLICLLNVPDAISPFVSYIFFNTKPPLPLGKRGNCPSPLQNIF
ncbi:hypothetical protein SAMN05444350_1574 [Bacteroides stercorirosoris]|uniref:Uncharacterized protein n=1 Tax=Bacteroides stercorirosoris TaxID=871324 RepID=A0A1M6LX66_9BACE|nr:hypothetical protein SAMN05444350_1574 [Bacteroides stercorirosoris]